jgi:hypothetical protein
MFVVPLCPLLKAEVELLMVLLQRQLGGAADPDSLLYLAIFTGTKTHWLKSKAWVIALSM